MVVRLTLPDSTTRLAYRDEEEIRIALEARREEETAAELLEPGGS